MQTGNERHILVTRVWVTKFDTSTTRVPVDKVNLGITWYREGGHSSNRQACELTFMVKTRKFFV